MPAVASTLLGQAPEADELIPYAVAAVVILLPVSVVCDILFTRKEIQKKAGFSMVIMIVHAVLFALLAIGTLMLITFLVVQSYITPHSLSAADTPVAIVSGVIVALLYAATLVRVLRPSGTRLVSIIYIAFMVVISTVCIILAIVGPVAATQKTANDRLIDAQLPALQTAIDSYIDANNTLPASLSDLKLTGDTQTIIDQKLVTYTAVGKSDETSTYSISYRYQLCANYVAKDSNSNSPGAIEPMLATSDGYTSYLSTSGHAAGTVCYKLSHERSLPSAGDVTIDANTPDSGQ